MTASLNLHPFYNQKQKRWTRLVNKHEKMGSGRVRKGSIQKVIALLFFCQLCVNSLPAKKKLKRVFIITVETMLKKKKRLN